MDGVGHGALALWHGFGVPLLLSAVVVLLGWLAWRGRHQVEELQQRLPHPPSGGRIFDIGVARLMRGADVFIGHVQTGSLPLYLLVILSTVLVVPGGALLLGVDSLPEVDLADDPGQVVAVVLMGVASVGAVTMRQRLAAVVCVGAVGYGMAVLFMYQGAPDLALTQVLVETLLLVLFVLVLRHLPGRFAPNQTSLSRGSRAVVSALVGVLVTSGLLAEVTEMQTKGYRLRSSAMALMPGDGRGGAPDPVRRTFEAENRPRVIAFFRDLYTNTGHDLKALKAAEHTAQVRAEDREEREKAFRRADLPLLFCSPTMELGVDIASLNAVAMRNVPPTPANYAQRSGRAGRSGQQALVVTYCSSGNSHDSYYFERSDQMVAGKVTPPRLDLANEDLVRSHIQALWLAEALALTDAGLQSSMASVVDLGQDGYPLRDELVTALKDTTVADRARQAAHALLDPLRGELEDLFARRYPGWDEVASAAAR